MSSKFRLNKQTEKNSMEQKVIFVRNSLEPISARGLGETFILRDKGEALSLTVMKVVFEPPEPGEEEVSHRFT